MTTTATKATSKTSAKAEADDKTEKVSSKAVEDCAYCDHPHYTVDNPDKEPRGHFTKCGECACQLTTKRFTDTPKTAPIA